jgi:hypothetical protein
VFEYPRAVEVEWSPRRLAFPVEWEILVPGQPEPIALIRRVRITGRVCFRAVTWAKESRHRRLIGYYPDGDAAAAAVWSGYVASRRTQHDRASHTHGGRERNAPGPAH